MSPSDTYSVKDAVDAAVDGDILLVSGRFETNAIDQTQVDDIHWNFGIVALLKGTKNLVFSQHSHNDPTNQISVREL